MISALCIRWSLKVLGVKRNVIRLRRGPPPPELTLAKQARLTATFLRNGKATVWNKDYIREKLEASSESKCAYCEGGLGAVQAVQVDHYHPKSLKPFWVVRWENLVPACGRCNRRKSNANMAVDPILNPYVDEPRDHIELSGFEIRGTTPLGENTVSLLDLDDLSETRFRIYRQISAHLRSVVFNLRNFDRHPPHLPAVAREGVLGLRAVLRRVQTNEVYSATTSSWLLRDRLFAEAEEILRRHHIWTDELQNLRDRAERIALAHP